MQLLNPNPIVYSRDDAIGRETRPVDRNKEGVYDPLDIYELIRDITDPEHPYTLEQLKVVSLELIEVDSENKIIKLCFTPTVPHCSMATLIGLSIRVKLQNSLPSAYKIDIKVTPGSHSSEVAVNKQLGDKERIAAALENPNLRDMVEHCLTAAAATAAAEKAAQKQMSEAQDDKELEESKREGEENGAQGMDVDLPVPNSTESIPT